LPSVDVSYTATPTHIQTVGFTSTPTRTATPIRTSTAIVTFTATPEGPPIAATETATPEPFPATVTPTPIFTQTVVITPSTEPPAEVAKAYPNPARHQVNFKLPANSRGKRVLIVIYNGSGEVVAKLEEGAAGSQGLIWRCRGVATGIYRVRVFVDGKEVRKLKVCIVL